MKTLFALVLLATSAHAQGLRGIWTGTYKTPSSNGGELTIRVDSARSGWTVEVMTKSEYSSPNPQFVGATSVRVVRDSVSWTLNWGPQVVNWHGTFKGGEMAGGVASQYWNGTWAVRKAAAKPNGWNS